MEHERHCEHCGFDLGRVEMTVVLARKGAAAKRLFCPICRSDRVKLRALERVFPRAHGDRWARWRDGGPPGAPDVVAVGRLQLRIEGEVEPLTKEQICFRAVPVFVSAGARVVPALPVRPEFLDCLDPAQVRAAREHPERFGRIVSERGRARYQCLLPLRGLRPGEWPTYECDLLPANPYSPNAGDADAGAFRGVTLQLWPNLRRPTHAWRCYVASLQAATEEGMTLFAPGRTPRATMWVPACDAEGRPLSETALDAVPLDQETGREGDGGPSGCCGATTAGRPSWISVAFEQATQGGGTEVVGGGMFAVAPAVDASPSDTWNVGIDFGTSNTVIAVKRRDGTLQCVAPERGRDRVPTSLRLVDGGPPTLQRGLDLWPGGGWSGPQHDLLPSELGCVRRWSDVANVEAIRGLVFGRDFGVPLRGAGASVSPEQIVGEFKWLRAVEKDKSALARPELVQALQARYLEAALLMASAAVLADEETAPRTVNATYSFPLAFDEGDLESLRRAAEDAATRLKELTGADFVFPATPLVDEAQAAAGHASSDKAFRVYLDLGGGSLEVLVDDTLARKGQQGHAGLHPHVFSSSLFFGGSVFLRSLVGAGEGDRRGSCVMPAVGSYTRLSSAVRQSVSARSLLESPHVIVEARRATAERRARVFIGYIVEYAARVLAGVCLEHGRTASGALDLSRNRLFSMTGTGAQRRWILGVSRGPEQKRVVEFSLVLLGNGWGFGDLVRDGMKSVEQMMAHRVYERLRALLQETPIAREIGDGDVHLLDPRLAFEVTFVATAEGSHRKAAVALGLLGAHHGTEDASRFFRSRAPERHGVLGFDVWLDDQKRQVPWYRPFGPPAQDDPSLFEPPLAASPVVATPTTPVAVPPAAPAGPPLPTPGAPVALPLEMIAFALVQQWGSLAAQAAQAGTSAQDLARRQLWQQIAAQAGLAAQTPERFLAAQQWEKMTRSLAVPGMTPEQSAWMHQQQWSTVAAQAAQRGVSADTWLSMQRWEHLAALLVAPGGGSA